MENEVVHIEEEQQQHTKEHQIPAISRPSRHYWTENRNEFIGQRTDEIIGSLAPNKRSVSACIVYAVRIVRIHSRNSRFRERNICKRETKWHLFGIQVALCIFANLPIHIYDLCFEFMIFSLRKKYIKSKLTEKWVIKV